MIRLPFEAFNRLGIAVAHVRVPKPVFAVKDKSDRFPRLEQTRFLPAKIFGGKRFTF